MSSDKYCFETLPKVQEDLGSHKKVGGDEAEVCEIQITYDNPKNLELSVELPLEDDKFTSLTGEWPENSGSSRQSKKKSIQWFLLCQK